MPPTNMYTHEPEDMHKNVHSGSIYKSQALEKPMSFNKMDKLIVVCLYNGILHSTKII